MEEDRSSRLKIKSPVRFAALAMKAHRLQDELAYLGLSDQMIPAIVKAFSGAKEANQWEEYNKWLDAGFNHDDWFQQHCKELGKTI